MKIQVLFSYPFMTDSIYAQYNANIFG